MKNQKLKVETEVYLSAPSTQVWKLLGDFNSVPKWHPAIEASSLEENGKVRRLGIVDDGENVEKLIEYDENSQFYTYTMVEGPIPVSDYFATLKVKEITDEKTLVTWTGEFKPEGVSEAKAKKGVQDFLQAGMDNLKKMFG